MYPLPTVAGGSAPVSLACTPKSGTLFPVGSTIVSCTATDAQQRTDVCTFTVTVTPPPRLLATRFLAYGDSMTEGKISSASISPYTPMPAAYTSVLTTLLNAQYPAQAATFSVINSGLGGETVASALSSNRFSSALQSVAPDALLLLEGANDLIAGTAPAAVVTGLQSMVRQAREEGVRVFLATLPPERAPAGGVAMVVPTNDLIRSMAISEGATLVDLYGAFGSSPDPYIGVDGLHPTAAGYDKMAQTFFGAIKTRLEVPQELGRPVIMTRARR